MRCFIIALAILGMAAVGSGQDDFPNRPHNQYLINDVKTIDKRETPPIQYNPHPFTQVCELPGIGQKAQLATPVIPSATPANSRSVRIEHLTQAVTHLEAAGLKEDANKIREKVNAEKVAAAGDIKALQEEIERLRALIGKPAPQVLLYVRVLEISWKDLAATGYKLPDDLHSSLDVIFRHEKKGEGGLFNSPVSRGPCIFDSHDQLFATLKMLQKKNAYRILAEPTIVTVSNQRGDFCVGGQFAVPSLQDGGKTAEWKNYGTQVSFSPVVLADNKIRLNCHVEISHLDMNREVTIAGMKVPGVCNRSVTTNTELRSGQTLVLGGLVQTRTPEAPDDLSTAFAWCVSTIGRAITVPETSNVSAADKTPAKNEKNSRRWQISAGSASARSH